MNDPDTLPVDAPRSCPECGRPLVPTSPQGLCSHCLLAAVADERPVNRDLEPTSEAPDLRRLGNYEILSELAQGGMGVVYRARHVQLRRRVALKMIAAGHFASNAEVARFRIEAEAAARLEHPHIIPVYEIGEESGRHYFTMKLVEGGSLGAALREGPLPPRRAALLIANVARAVHFAHERGILHRDLKPNNILLDGPDHPLLTDFGLAKFSDDRAELTQSLAILGSAHYMAPEQARGESKQLTTAADVYGLGAVLYETLVGHPPFQGDSVLDVLRRVIEDAPIPPSRLNGAVDRDLETVCLRCLEKDPRHRYPTAEHLALDLERWLRHEPVEARPTSRTERLLKWSRRKPALAALIAVSLASLVILGALKAQHASQSADRLHTLLREQARAERLLGRRDAALRLLGEAAAMERTASLRDEAIQALAEPGLSLAFEAPFGSVATAGFSPDGHLFAAGGDVPAWRDGRVVTESLVRVWSLPSGKPLADFAWNLDEGPFAFSPDSRLLAVPQTGPSVALYELDTGRIRNRVAASGAPLFSQDGLHLALTESNRVRILRVENLQEVSRRTGFFATRAFVAPDSLLLHAWPRTDDGDLRLWNFVDGSERRLHGNQTFPIASANGQVMGLLPLKSAENSSEMVFVNTRTGSEESRLKPPNVEAAVELSATGSHIAFASPQESGRFLLYEVRSGRFAAGVGDPGSIAPSAFIGFRHSAGSIVSQVGSTPRREARWPSPSTGFSPDGSVFACESRQGERNLTAWEVGSGRRLGVIPTAGRPVWSGDGQWLAVEHDGVVILQSSNLFHQISGRVVVQVWSVSHGIPVRHLATPVRSIAFSADGRHLAAENGLWRFEPGTSGPRLEPSDRAPVQGTLRFAGNQAWEVDAPPYRSTARFLFREWSQPTRVFEPLAIGAGRAFAFSPDGRTMLLAVAGNPSTAGDAEGAAFHYELWNLERRERQSLWNHGPDAQNANDKPGLLAFSADGSLFASSCFTDEGIDLWDTKAGRLVSRLHPPPLKKSPTLPGFTPDSIREREVLVNHIAFTPDRRRVLYACLDQTVFREVESGRVLYRHHHSKQPVQGFAMSPDGRSFATGGEDRRLYLWDLETGREITHWEAHESPIESLVFHPEGTWIASGSREGTFKLWHLPTLRRDLARLGLDW